MEKSEQAKPNLFVKWKHSYSGRAAWIVLTLVIAYLFASLAIDTGTLWQWGIAALFAIDGVYNIGRLAAKIYANRRKTSKA